jgi:hypothetical protein
LSASAGGLSKGRTQSPVCRVSLDDYRRNLERIIEEAERCSARVTLLTAPTAYTDSSDVPDYLVAEGFAPDKATVLRMHRAYNDVVREVARSQSAFLIDCAAGFDASPKKKLLFGQDGIHPNELGDWLIAAKVFRGFVHQGWVDPGDYKPEDLEDIGLEPRGSDLR